MSVMEVVTDKRVDFIYMWHDGSPYDCAPRFQTCARNKKIFFNGSRRSGHFGTGQSRAGRASPSDPTAKKTVKQCSPLIDRSVMSVI